jgi:glucose-6-phosphate isomerase
MLPNQDFTKTPAFNNLKIDFNRLNSITIKSLFDANEQRHNEFSLAFNELFFDYSKNLLDQQAFNNLIELAHQTGLKSAINAQFSGDVINVTENRSVLHTALRANAHSEILINGKNIMIDIQLVKNQMKDFITSVYNKILGNM